MERINTSEDKMEQRKQFFIEIAQNVLSGKYNFADSSIEELTKLDPDGQDTNIQELIKRLPEAEVQNCISTALSYYDQDEVGAAISWIGQARESLNRLSTKKSLDEDIKVKLNELFMQATNEIYSKLN